MRTFFLMILLVSLPLCPAVGADLNSDQITALREQASSLLQALLDGDVEAIADATYRPLIDRYDNEDTFIEELTMLAQQMQEGGLMPTGFEMRDPQQLVDAGEELHSVVPYTLIFESKKQVVRADSYLLAITRSDSRKWTFLEGHGFSETARERLLPHFNSALRLPEIQEPEIAEIAMDSEEVDAEVQEDTAVDAEAEAGEDGSIFVE